CPAAARRQQLCLFVVSPLGLAQLKPTLTACLPAGHWQLIRLDTMPVDGRHNSKIDRPGLRAGAFTALERLMLEQGE
uniref:hypothetical protein n=1 Tax=Endozoicomonas sp. ONNA2 TaxID=2828741 RepID=UPI002147532F